MSPYALELAHARIDALRTLIDAMNEAETPEEKRRCAVAIFNAPDPNDFDDEIEIDDDEDEDEDEDDAECDENEEVAETDQNDDSDDDDTAADSDGDYESEIIENATASLAARDPHHSAAPS